MIAASSRGRARNGQATPCSHKKGLKEKSLDFDYISNSLVDWPGLAGIGSDL